MTEKTDRQRGLYRKYEVRRLDGRGGPDDEYIVLRVRPMSFASPEWVALAAYADAVATEYPAFAADLRSRYLSTVGAPPVAAPLSEGGPTVTRLDYSKPPPMYRIDEQDSEWDWSCGDPVNPDDGNASFITSEAEALAAAWSHYKGEHDPPGMVVHHVSWWPAALSSQGPLGGDTTSHAFARAAAWAWYDRRLALADRLDGGTFCPECHSQDAHVEPIDAKTTTQPWCTECDVEMGGLFDDLWPRCLTWSDEQASEVERWLVDSMAEMPEVLRG